MTVRVTCGDRDEATRVADRLISGRLAACVHVSDIDSVYEWQGAVERDRETEVAAITSAERLGELVAAVEAMHSYDLPAITWTPLSATPAYLAWVDEQVAPR